MIGTVLTTGDNELILVSHQGLAVRFPQARSGDGRGPFPPTGRATGGVTGMQFKLESDHLDVIEVVDPRPSSSSRGKPASACARFGTIASSTAAAPASGRSRCPGTAPSTSPARSASATPTRSMLLTAKGQSIRCPVKDIRETNRGAKGVKLSARRGRQAPQHRAHRRDRRATGRRNAAAGLVGRGVHARGSPRTVRPAPARGNDTRFG